MPNQIIDDVQTLMGLSDNELTEVLLDEKYNKANLRELVRRSLKEAIEYKNAFYYEKQQHEKYRKVIQNAISNLNEANE